MAVQGAIPLAGVQGAAPPGLASLTLPHPPLLVISDRRQAPGRDLARVAEAAFAAGGRWFSVREKDLAPSERLALLARVVAVGRGHGACVMIHGDVSAARAVGAGGVHLPAGGDVRAARAVLGAGVVIGVSAHSAAEVRAAAGADYVTVSPVFLSDSKPGYGPALGLAGVRALAGLGVPVLALGGVDVARVGGCLAAGAVGVAVMGGVMRAADMGGVVRGLLAGLGRAAPAGSPN